MKEANEVFEKIIAEHEVSPLTIVTASKLYQMIANGATFIRDMPEVLLSVQQDGGLSLRWDHAEYKIHIVIPPNPKTYEEYNPAAFDQQCEYVMQELDAETVILVVANGKISEHKRQNGFSIQTFSADAQQRLPLLLRMVADHIEAQEKPQPVTLQ